MNLDNPDSRLFDLLMEVMYGIHPINTPILGTKESIARITPQVLTDCHKAFYKPDNMFLCVVGDVDPEEVAQLAEARFATLPNPKVTAPREWSEPMETTQKEITTQMEVAMPMFQLGFKAEALPNGEEGVKGEIIGDLAAEALFGESSALYLRMYEQWLIDGSFGGGFETVDGLAMLTAFGDSEEPEKVRDAILQEAERLCKEGIDRQAFLRMKRSALGRRIRDLDSFDSTAFRICAYHFSKFDYFRFPAIYRSVQIPEILEFLQRVVTSQRCSLSVINPKQT